MRTHKYCYWCGLELEQNDLETIKKIGQPVHKKCWKELDKLIQEVKK